MGSPRHIAFLGCRRLSIDAHIAPVIRVGDEVSTTGETVWPLPSSAGNSIWLPLCYPSLARYVPASASPRAPAAANGRAIGLPRRPPSYLWLTRGRSDAFLSTLTIQVQYLHQRTHPLRNDELRTGTVGTVCRDLLHSHWYAVAHFLVYCRLNCPRLPRIIQCCFGRENLFSFG